MESFRFATEVRVRFAETDAQGVAHNATYLVWFEIARVDYLAAYAGGYPALRARGIEAFVVEANVRYGTKPLPKPEKKPAAKGEKPVKPGATTGTTPAETAPTTTEPAPVEPPPAEPAVTDPTPQRGQ